MMVLIYTHQLGRILTALRARDGTLSLDKEAAQPAGRAAIAA
ncbi:MAG: hypothetical protein WB683_15315 [Candidatus Sulfotelmatobacter sp.]